MHGSKLSVANSAMDYKAEEQYQSIGGKKHKALDVATQCIQNWNSFLDAQGIKFSES